MVDILLPCLPKISKRYSFPSNPSTFRILSPKNRKKQSWLMVSTPLKNLSQNGNLPQIGVKIKNMWNHHTESIKKSLHHFWDLQGFQVFFKSWARLRSAWDKGWLALQRWAPQNQVPPTKGRQVEGWPTASPSISDWQISGASHTVWIGQTPGSKYKDIKWYQYTYKFVYAISQIT